MLGKAFEHIHVHLICGDQNFFLMKCSNVISVRWFREVQCCPLSHEHKGQWKDGIAPFLVSRICKPHHPYPACRGWHFLWAASKTIPQKAVCKDSLHKRGKKIIPELLCCFLLCSAAWRQKIWVNRRSPGSSLQPLVNWSVQIAGKHPTAWWGGDGCYILLHTSYFQIDSFQNAWVVWKYFLSYS